MAERISILIDLKDGFSRGIRTIRGEAKKLNRTIDRELNGSLSILKNRLAQLGAGLGAVALSKLGQDAEETANRFRQVFGPETDAASKAVERLAVSVGRSRAQLQGGISTFQTFFVGLGFARDEARRLSEQMTELSLDFASFNNLSDSEAVERFISALSGSSEVLDRFGVNLRVAALDQQLLSSGLADSAQKATETQKALARIGIISKSLGSQGAIGDAERTAGSFANQLKRVTGQALDAGAAIGLELNRAILPYLQSTGDAITDAAEWIKANRETVESIISLAITVGKAVIAIKALKAALGVGRIVRAFGASVLNAASSVSTYTESTTGAAVATKGFAAALTATGIGAALVALSIAAAKLVTELDKLEKANVKLGESLVNERVARQVRERVDLIRGAADDLSSIGRTFSRQLEFILEPGAGEGFGELQQRLDAIERFNSKPTVDGAKALQEQFGLTNDQLLKIAGNAQDVRIALERAFQAQRAEAAAQRARVIIQDDLNRGVEEYRQQIIKLVDAQQEEVNSEEALRRARRAVISDLSKQLKDLSDAAAEISDSRSFGGALELGILADRQRAKEIGGELGEIAEAYDRLWQRYQLVNETAGELIRKGREAGQEAKSSLETQLEIEERRTQALQDRTDQASRLATIAAREEQIRGQIQLGQLDEIEGLRRIANLRQEALRVQQEQVHQRIAETQAAIDSAIVPERRIELQRKLNDLLAHANELAQQASSEQQNARLQERIALQDREREAVEALADQYRNYISIAQTLVGTPLSGYFDDLLSGTKSASDAFDDFTRSVVANFTRMVAQLIAQRAILAAVGLFFPGGAAAAGGAGLIGGFNEGGPVPGGGPNRDSVTAALTPGEWVIQRPAVQQLVAQYGKAAMHAINRGTLPLNRGGPVPRSLPKLAFNTGGQVQPISGSAPVAQSVLVANEAQFEQLLGGGRAAMIRFAQDNAGEMRSALGIS